MICWLFAIDTTWPYWWCGFYVHIRRRLYWRHCDSVVYSAADSEQQSEIVSSDSRHLS